MADPDQSLQSKPDVAHLGWPIEDRNRTRIKRNISNTSIEDVVYSAAKLGDCEALTKFLNYMVSDLLYSTLWLLIAPRHRFSQSCTHSDLPAMTRITGREPWSGSKLAAVQCRSASKHPFRFL